MPVPRGVNDSTRLPWTTQQPPLVHPLHHPTRDDPTQEHHPQRVTVRGLWQNSHRVQRAATRSTRVRHSLLHRRKCEGARQGDETRVDWKHGFKVWEEFGGAGVLLAQKVKWHIHWVWPHEVKCVQVSALLSPIQSSALHQGWFASGQD